MVSLLSLNSSKRPNIAIISQYFVAGCNDCDQGEGFNGIHISTLLTLYSFIIIKTLSGMCITTPKNYAYITSTYTVYNHTQHFG